MNLNKFPSVIIFFVLLGFYSPSTLQARAPINEEAAKEKSTKCDEAKDEVKKISEQKQNEVYERIGAEASKDEPNQEESAKNDDQSEKELLEMLEDTLRQLSHQVVWYVEVQEKLPKKANSDFQEDIKQYEEEIQVKRKGKFANNSEKQTNYNEKNTLRIASSIPAVSYEVSESEKSVKYPDLKPLEPRILTLEEKKIDIHERIAKKCIGESPFQLKLLINYLNNYEDKIRRGINLRRRFLLYGKSGTGKTHRMKVIASETATPIFILDATFFSEKLVGEGPKRLEAVFNFAKKHQGPIIIFIDEFDTLVQTNPNAHEEHNKTYSALLRELQDIDNFPHIFFVAATNFINKIPAAVKNRLFGNMCEIKDLTQKEKGQLIRKVFADEFSRRTSLAIINNPTIVKSMQAMAAEIYSNETLCNRDIEDWIARVVEEELVHGICEVTQQDELFKNKLKEKVKDGLLKKNPPESLFELVHNTFQKSCIVEIKKLSQIKYEQFIMEICAGDNNAYSKEDLEKIVKGVTSKSAFFAEKIRATKGLSRESTDHVAIEALMHSIVNSLEETSAFSTYEKRLVFIIHAAGQDMLSRSEIEYVISSVAKKHFEDQSVYNNIKNVMTYIRDVLDEMIQQTDDRVIKSRLCTARSKIKQFTEADIIQLTKNTIRDSISHFASYLVENHPKFNAFTEELAEVFEGPPYWTGPSYWISGKFTAREIESAIINALDAQDDEKEKGLWFFLKKVCDGGDSTPFLLQDWFLKMSRVNLK